MKKSLKKIAMVILLTAALGVPAVFMMGATSPKCSGDKCTSNSECGQGEICSGGVCYLCNPGIPGGC